jgi:hypothetical protein
MPYLLKKAVALTAYRFSFWSLFFASAAILVLSAPRAQAQDRPAEGALRGYISPPPGEGYPTQPVPSPVQVTPRATAPREKDPEQATPEGLEKKEKSSRRLPHTVSNPPEVPFAVNTAMLGLKLVSADVLERLSFGGGAQRKALEPGPGKKLIVAVLEGKTLEPFKMPIGILDFSAFWVEEHPRTLYGKTLSDRTVQVGRAVALETPKGWMIEAEGLPSSALFYFVEPGPVSLRVAFFLPQGVTHFGIRYPLVADSGAMLSIPIPAAPAARN